MKAEREKPTTISPNAKQTQQTTNQILLMMAATSGPKTTPIDTKHSVSDERLQPFKFFLILTTITHYYLTPKINFSVEGYCFK